MNSTWLYIVCKSATYRSIILFPLQSNDIVLIILNLLVCNCRAEISPRPVSQDVHLCTTFYLYRLNYAAHTLQILCFCQQLVYFWGDKSRTDDKQPLSESVFYIRQPTLLKLWANMMCRKIPATETTPRAIQHAAFQDISYPLTRSQRDRIWIMIFHSFSRYAL